VNAKLLLLLIGLIVGAGVGWFTKPPAASVQLGNLNIQVDASGQPINEQISQLTDGQWYYIGMITALGGLLGLGLAVLVDRRA
jgi:hypothetical protein